MKENFRNERSMEKGIEYNNYNHTKYVGEFLKGKKVEKEKNILLVIINILTKIIMINII